MARLVWLTSFLLALTALAGCGGPTLIPTEGTVVGPDGKPLANVMVQFSPIEDSGSRTLPSYGVTDEAGKFVLKSGDGKPGAVAGKHKVTLSDNALEHTDDANLGKEQPKTWSRIPASYLSATTSPLDVTVEAGKQHELKVILPKRIEVQED